MKDKATVPFRRSSSGEVTGEIINESGEIIISKSFEIDAVPVVAVFYRGKDNRQELTRLKSLESGTKQRTRFFIENGTVSMMGWERRMP